jgi:hypothetical protein
MLTDKERHVAWTKEAVHSSTFEKARRWDWETSDCSLHAASVRDGRSHGETSRGCELQGSPWSFRPNVYLLTVLRGHCSAWFTLRQLREVAGPLIRRAGSVRFHITMVIQMGRKTCDGALRQPLLSLPPRQRSATDFMHMML